jgi:hypothetical protein
MSFGTTTQDSRDPNSPQWGYLKVKDPENELEYPAKDETWNEYVIFVHDQDKNPIDKEKYSKVSTKAGGIKARTDLESIMVPATLTISADHCTVKLNSVKQQVEDLNRQLEDPNDTSHREYCSRKVKELEKERKILSHLIDRGQNIEIPSKGKTPDETTLWVALIVDIRE